MQLQHPRTALHSARYNERNLKIRQSFKFLSTFQSYESCSQFTHYNSVGVCYVWETCTSFSDTSCSDCISGDADCPSSICSEPGLCVGIQVGFSIEATEGDCITSCLNSVDCQWYSYDVSSQFCTLSETCQSIQTCSNDNCVHGQKECEIPSKHLL